MSDYQHLYVHVEQSAHVYSVRVNIGAYSNVVVCLCTWTGYYNVSLTHYSVHMTIKTTPVKFNLGLTWYSGHMRHLTRV